MLGNNVYVALLVNPVFILKTYQYYSFNYRDGDTTTTMPDWVKSQWSHTHGMYKRVGGCTIVGMNDRGSQIAAANCDTEVADIICQPR